MGVWVQTDVGMARVVHAQVHPRPVPDGFPVNSLVANDFDLALTERAGDRNRQRIEHPCDCFLGRVAGRDWIVMFRQNIFRLLQIALKRMKSYWQ